MTGHVGVVGAMGKIVEQLPPGCWVPRVQSGVERDSVWVIFFVDVAISMESRWKEDVAKCKR